MAPTQTNQINLNPYMMNILAFSGDQHTQMTYDRAGVQVYPKFQVGWFRFSEMTPKVYHKKRKAQNHW